MAGKPAGRTLVIVAVALVAAAVLGYWGYGAYQKRELHGAIGAALKNTGGQLREALAIETGPAPADRLKVAEKLDEFATAADKSIEQLKRLPVARDLALADNADGHLVTAREIFRRQAAANRALALHAESLAALRDHMRVDNRSSAWVQQAVRAKERVEKDYRDYRIAVDTCDKLLGELPASQKRIASHIGAEALVENSLIGKARERAAETAAQIAAEMEKVRRLAAPK